MGYAQSGWIHLDAIRTVHETVMEFSIVAEVVRLDQVCNDNRVLKSRRRQGLVRKWVNMKEPV